MAKASLDVGLIKSRMRFKGLDSKSIGRSLGVSPDMVRGWLNKGEASMENAVRLAALLGMTIVDITVAA